MSQPLSITTRHDHDVCDVCARTLLRGERTETFLSDGHRYNVCELCKPHALHEGWMREGALPEFQGMPERAPRRRSLLGRRRARSRRTDAMEAADARNLPRTLDDELSFTGYDPLAPFDDLQNGIQLTPPPAARPLASQGTQVRYDDREPRHVHAIPSADEHKISAAVGVFNASGHSRTVAGVARSLGAPMVTVFPDQAHAASVWVVVAWELCWYRYEVDLSDARGNVRLDAQGYELDQLAGHERIGNCGCDESGSLLLL